MIIISCFTAVSLPLIRSNLFGFVLGLCQNDCDKYSRNIAPRRECGTEFHYHTQLTVWRGVHERYENRFTWYSPNCRHTMPFQKSSHTENFRCSPARSFIQFDTTSFRTFFAVTAFDHWARDIQFNKFEINFASSQCQINWVSCTVWRVHGEAQIHENVVMRWCGLKWNVFRNSFWCENKNESIYEVWHSIEHFTADTCSGMSFLNTTIDVCSLSMLRSLQHNSVKKQKMRNQRVGLMFYRLSLTRMRYDLVKWLTIDHWK